MILDTHQHFWALGDPYTDWPTPAEAGIYRDFAPADLAPLLRTAGVSGTVLVQAAPSMDETARLLALADANPFVAGVVGWIDFAGSDALDHLRAFAKHPKFKGIRPMLQSIDAPGWILKPAFTPVFEALVELGLTFDALVRSAQIPEIDALAWRYPALPIAIDHAGKPGGHGSDYRAWADDIASLSQQSNVVCKFSGLWTESDDFLAPGGLEAVTSHLLQTFGEDRLMWGSDWPVVNLKATYGAWLDAAVNVVDSLCRGGLERIFCENGKSFYAIQ